MTLASRAKQAGQNAALDAFGLTRTEKPPPTWAHGRKVTIPSMAQVACKHDQEKPS